MATQTEEKTLHWKSLYKDLRRKEIEFVKVNNVSFIVSMEHEVDTLEKTFTYSIY